MGTVPQPSRSPNLGRNEHEFTWLVEADRHTLLETLAVTQQDLANLHCEIAYARTCESKDNPSVYHQRILMEGDRDALAEKKWLILRLLDGAST